MSSPIHHTLTCVLRGGPGQGRAPRACLQKVFFLPESGHESGPPEPCWGTHGATCKHQAPVRSTENKKSQPERFPLDIRALGKSLWRATEQPLPARPAWIPLGSPASAPASRTLSSPEAGAGMSWRGASARRAAGSGGERKRQRTGLLTEAKFNGKSSSLLYYTLVSQTKKKICR